MKGISLPVNMIVIIAIAVLVLVVIAAFFTSQTGSGINTIALEEAFSRGCATWRSAYNCDPASITFTVSGYSAPGTTTPATFRDVCFQKVGSTTGGAPSGNAVSQCQRQCGCPTGAGGAACGNGRCDAGEQISCPSDCAVPPPP